MQNVLREVRLQELGNGLYRVVMINSNEDEYQVVDNKSLLEALNVVSLLSTGTDFVFDEKTLKIAI